MRQVEMFSFQKLNSYISFRDSAPVALRAKSFHADLIHRQTESGADNGAMTRRKTSSPDVLIRVWSSENFPFSIYGKSW